MEDYMGNKTGHGWLNGAVLERNKTTVRLLLLGVAAVVLTVTPAHAVPLSTLVSTDGNIQVGDKQFTNFELHDTTAQFSTPADPGNLDIQGFTNGLGEHGLRISPFSVSIPQANSSGAFVFTIEYDVTVTDPLFLLHDVRHAFSTTSNRGGGLSVISQAGFPADLNASMQSVVGFGGTGELIVDNVNEHEVFAHDVPSQHMLHNFEAHALTVNLTSQGGPVVLGAISTSPIDLTFSQTVIPEPGTWLLVASGLAALIRLRRSFQHIHIR
jgi:hypothetical protein